MRLGVCWYAGVMLVGLLVGCGGSSSSRSSAPDVERAVVAVPADLNPATELPRAPKLDLIPVELLPPKS